MANKYYVGVSAFVKVQLKVRDSVNLRGKVTNPILTTRWPKRSSTRRPTVGGDILTLKGVLTLSIIHFFARVRQEKNFLYPFYFKRDQTSGQPLLISNLSLRML